MTTQSSTDYDDVVTTESDSQHLTPGTDPSAPNWNDEESWGLPVLDGDDWDDEDDDSFDDDEDEDFFPDDEDEEGFDDEEEEDEEEDEDFDE